MDPKIMVPLAAGIFILPFFLFSAMAGQLADKFEKARLIRIIQFLEILIMFAAAIAFIYKAFYLLLVILFFMGLQSTFFGPLKYAILPDHLRRDELIEGNAWIESATFVAILLGTAVGGILMSGDGKQILIISTMVMFFALIGWLSSCFIPKAPPPDPGLRFDANFIRASWRSMCHATENREVFLSIMGITWFWFLGASFIAQLSPLAKEVFRADNTVATVFSLAFAIGIAIGSFFCNKLLQGQIHTRYVLWAALGISLFSLDLAYSSSYWIQSIPIHQEANLMDVTIFLSHARYWRILLDFLLIAFCSGLYIVPLYAIMQSRSDPERRARIIASNNVINSLFMVVSALGIIALLKLDFTFSRIFLTLAMINGLFVLLSFSYLCWYRKRH